MIQAQNVHVDLLQEDLNDAESRGNDLLRDIKLLDEMHGRRQEYAVSFPDSDKLKIRVAGDLQDFKTPAEYQSSDRINSCRVNSVTCRRDSVTCKNSSITACLCILFGKSPH